jgi:Ca-activated chloride channel family protein
MCLSTRAVTAALAALPLFVSQLPCQGWIETISPISGNVVKLRSAVSAVLQGRVASVTVEEWFENRGTGLGEGVYHYPLPGEAVFSSFSLWQGDTELRGETMDANQARAVYEAIVRRRRDPALIELARHGLLRAHIFPIRPGETRKITLRYNQLLDREGDAWRFHYLAGVGPATTNTSRSLRLTVQEAARFGEPYSPTHRFSTHRASDRLEVTVADSSAGDLDLFLPLARDRVGLSLVTHRPVGEDGYFMLLLAPARREDAPAPPRDVVAVLDVSGSMSGEKLDQAKRALMELLGSLRSGDRFRLIAFASGVRRFAEGWSPVSAETRNSAVAWLEALEPGGGTNIGSALEEAFHVHAAEAALGVVVFLTDGLPTVGEQDPEQIATRAEARRAGFRVFAFGIGYDVNTYLLDRLTERARGTTAYIAPNGDIESSVGPLTAKITSPVLTDVTIRASPGIELYDLQPGTIPDLFAGEELVLFGRYRHTSSVAWSVSVTGRRAGRIERFQTAAARPMSRAEFVPRLWASRKAGALSREIRLHGPTPELMTSLKDLALRYGILTEYTAYLVREPTLVSNGVTLREDHTVPSVAPAAPRNQVGEGAVARSLKESQQATASVLGVEPGGTTGLAGSSSGVVRRVGGRLFVRHGGTWTDLRHADSLPVVRIAPFSDAYFALLQACPELVSAAGLAPVLVAGRRVSIEIVTGGRATLTPVEVTRILSDFRE